RADALSAWMVALIGLVGAAAAVEAPRYVGDAVARRFYALFHLFVFTMLLAVTTDDIGLMWCAIEGTTLASVFLVNFERTRASLEASYKYLLICSVGIAIAFLGTVLVYFADIQLFGDETYALRWTTLLRLAPGLRAPLDGRRGPVPLDHPELQAHARVLERRARRRRVRGLGFGGAWGVTGALLHIANHALAKSMLFLLAGRIRAAYDSAEIAAVRGLSRPLPRTGAAFLAGMLALMGLPPFGLFTSEVLIFGAGFREGAAAAAALGLALLLVAFAGLLRATQTMLYGTPAGAPPREPSGPWPVVPVTVALGPLPLT